jgi:hypothetical protein
MPSLRRHVKGHVVANHGGTLPARTAVRGPSFPIAAAQRLSVPSNDSRLLPLRC